ncbi:MAG: hypothetical protein AB9866_15675 [Syntrophobacteraceae bacterium]
MTEKNGIARLDPGDTKNDDARTVYLDEATHGRFQQTLGAQEETRVRPPMRFPE